MRQSGARLLIDADRQRDRRQYAVAAMVALRAALTRHAQPRVPRAGFVWGKGAVLPTAATAQAVCGQHNGRHFCSAAAAAAVAQHMH